MPATNPSALGTEKRFSDGDPNLHSIHPPSNNLPLSLNDGRSSVPLTLLLALTCGTSLYVHSTRCNLLHFAM